MLELWNKLAIDPSTGRLSTNFLLATVAPLLVAFMTMLSSKARDLAGGLVRRAWTLTFARRSHSQGWQTPPLPRLKEESRILIIDDENLAHFEQLKLRGFRVEHWHAVDRTRSEEIDKHYDALVLDVRGVKDDFDAKDGLDALELIRRDNPWIPTTINTAYLGDLTLDRRRLVKDLAQKSLPKLTRYSDFEKHVVELLHVGRSRQYFVDLLAKKGVVEPEAALRGLEAAPAKAPVWAFAKEVNPTPFQRDQVNAVFSIAGGILTGERWRKRR